MARAAGTNPAIPDGICEGKRSGICKGEGRSRRSTGKWSRIQGEKRYPPYYRRNAPTISAISTTIFSVSNPCSMPHITQKVTPSVPGIRMWKALEL